MGEMGTQPAGALAAARGVRLVQAVALLMVVAYAVTIVPGVRSKRAFTRSRTPPPVVRHAGSSLDR